jgi:hypothetical protein
MCVQVTLPASIYAAKQHAVTYYMQRDGIVKSIEGLIQRAAMPPRARFAAKKWSGNTVAAVARRRRDDRA